MEANMSILKEYEEIKGNFFEFVKESGELGDMFKDYYAESYKPGVIDTKTKRLMALCGAIVKDCKSCTIGQCNRAIEAGATVEEIFETLQLAMSLGGTLTSSGINNIMKFLKEKDMIK